MSLYLTEEMAADVAHLVKKMNDLEREAPKTAYPLGLKDPIPVYALLDEEVVGYLVFEDDYWHYTNEIEGSN